MTVKGTEGGDASEENSQEEWQEKTKPKMKVIKETHIQDGGITDEGVVIPNVNRYPQLQVVTLLNMLTPNESSLAISFRRR